MSMTKLALLLALAMGGLALCDGRPSGRGLLASTTFYCGGGGVAFDGNNRPGKLPTCATGSVLCGTGDADCSSNTCSATCKNDPTTLTLTRNSDGTVTVTTGGVKVDVGNAIYKGCNAYCEYLGGGTGGVPFRTRDDSVCGFSHADFCYTPCRCIKDKVTFSYDGKPVTDISLCPGAALPDKEYKAVDNCGKTLPVTVSDSSDVPEGGSCGTVTRTLAASCGDGQATKVQKITYEDSGINFSNGACPVVGSSKCLVGRELTPAVTYTGCVFKAEYKLQNACGVEDTKIVTCPFCAT